METHKIWSKILGYRIGDSVRITRDFQTLPGPEKGRIGEIKARSGGRIGVYLVLVGGYLIWLNEDYFEKVTE